GQLAGKFPGGKLGPDTTTVVTTPGGTDTYIKPEAYREVFAADLTRTQIAVGAASQRPIAGSALGEASTAAAWKEIPSWYLVARQDNAIPAAAQRFMAERAHAHTTEVNASHSVAVSRPDATASTIVAAARATR
ncbi:alpha/beta hydrolase, partial [Crossiella equi]